MANFHLPHQYPLLLVDGVVELVAKKKIHAFKNITFNDKIFKGHFPDNPLFPAIYIVEGCCQAAHLLFGSSQAVTAKLDDWKFLKEVKPGDKLEYFIEIEKVIGPFVTSSAKVFVSGQVVTKGQIIGKDL